MANTPCTADQYRHPVDFEQSRLADKARQAHIDVLKAVWADDSTWHRPKVPLRTGARDMVALVTSRNMGYL